MREIKFRGKRINNSEWVYGGFHKHLKVTPSPLGARKPREDDYAYLIIQSGFSDWNLPKPIEAHAIDPETVGQFTGLHDKNGVEIYEGDICSVINPWGEADKPCIVAYDEKVGGYPYSPEDGYGDFDISTIGWAMDIGYRFEVIGNVYIKA